MKTLYRISDNGYKKTKLEYADKFYCLDNYLRVFGREDIYIIADNCSENTLQRLKAYSLPTEITAIGSSAQSWRHAAMYALKNYTEKDVVYFLEDDYLHKPYSKEVILEGLEVADYVTLYDNPDKYIDKEKGGNPLIQGGGEVTKVMLTKSTHWKVTNSTTMTFACKLETLKEDWAIWDKNTKGKHPHDDMIFYELQGLRKLKFKLFGKNRELLVPIPGYSTHVEEANLAPLTDWGKI